MRLSGVLATLAVLLSLPCTAATSLTELYRAIPAPPADVATALTWVQNGQLSAPEVVTLEANLRAAHAAVLEAANNAPALSGAAEPDPSALAALAAGYQNYASAHSGSQAPAAALGARVQWLAKRFSGLRKRVEGSDRVPDVLEQELAAYRALFADWQGQRIGLLTQAQNQLAAAGDPGAIGSAADRATVQRYRAAMLNEVEVLLGLTRFAVERAAQLPSAEPSSVEPSGNTLWDLMSDPRKRPPS